MASHIQAVSLRSVRKLRVDRQCRQSVLCAGIVDERLRSHFDRRNLNCNCNLQVPLVWQTGVPLIECCNHSHCRGRTGNADQDFHPKCIFRSNREHFSIGISQFKEACVASIQRRRSQLDRNIHSLACTPFAGWEPNRVTPCGRLRKRRWYIRSSCISLCS